MVIAASQIPRWVQPAPTTTNGIATVALDNTATTVIAGTAPAPAAITAPAAVVTTALGDARIPYADDFPILPLVGATATVSMDNTGIAEPNLGVTNAITLVPITSGATAQPAVEAATAFVVFCTLTAEPIAIGNANVELYDYGQGSVPVLPFTLPTRFTDNPLNIQFADALFTVTGDGYDIGGATSGDARLTFTGSTPLTIRGNTPIFPFGLPIVFTDAANGRLGQALVTITAPMSAAGAVIADAQAAITAPMDVLHPSMFPWELPVALA